MSDGFSKRLIGVAFVLTLVVGAFPARAVMISCEKVIAKSNELARRGSVKKADVIYIGRKLETDARWVERCFQTYGRRITRHAQAGSEETEDMLERLEEAESVEPAKEEDQGYTKPLDALDPMDRQRPFPKWEQGDGKWPKRDKGKDHPEEKPWPRRDKGEPQQ